MSSVSVDVCERELVGVCKTGLLQLRRQLKQYVSELHALHTHCAQYNHVLQMAVKELCETAPPESTEQPVSTQQQVENVCNGQEEEEEVLENGGLMQHGIEAFHDVDNSWPSSTSDTRDKECGQQQIKSEWPPTNAYDADTWRHNEVLFSRSFAQVATPAAHVPELVACAPSSSSNTTGQSGVPTKPRRQRQKKTGIQRARVMHGNCTGTDRQLLCSAVYSGGRWLCPIEGCHHSYSDKVPQLKRHIMMCHTYSAKVHRCGHCSYTTRRRDSLVVHMRNVHSKDKRITPPSAPVHSNACG